MIIIDKTKPPPPIYVRTPIPTFNSDYERQKYFEENKRRCLEGYAGLPPTLYDYLQNQYLKHRIVPKGHDSVEPPIPRWASLMMHDAFDRTRKEKKVQGVIKARNVGLSTEGGALANYFAKYYAGSNSLITSKDQNGISVLFREKIYVPYQHLDINLRPDELAKNDTKQRCHLRLGVNHIGHDGKEQYSYSTIELRETSDTPSSPNNFSGQGAQYGYVDEAPLHSRREALFNSFIECFRDPQTKELDGFLLWGGTCEDTMTNEAIGELKKMVDDKELWDCNILFIPYWWGMFLTNGHPDQKKAEEWWDKEANKVANNPTKLRAFMRNNPRYESDIFESAGGGRWEEDTEIVIRTIKTDIKNADVACEKYSFIYYNNAVKAELNKSGSSWILEQPKQGCTYISCVDGVASDTDTGGVEGSNLAATIVKIFDPNSDPYMPVSIHSERPKTIEGAYEKIVNQARFYNMYGGFLKFYAEANAATASHFGNYLMQNDLKKWIAMRRDLSGKGWVDQKKMFQYRTPELIDFQYKQANIFIRKYPNSIKMMPLIDQMLLPKNANADILDSWLQFFTAITDFGQVKKEKPKPRTRETVTIEMTSQGTIYKKIPY